MGVFDKLTRAYGKGDARVEYFHYFPQTLRGNIIGAGIGVATTIAGGWGPGLLASVAPVARGYEALTDVLGNAVGQRLYDYAHLHSDPSAWYRVTGTQHPDAILQRLNRQRMNRLRQQSQKSANMAEEGPTYVVPLEITGRAPASPRGGTPRLRPEEPGGRGRLGLLGGSVDAGEGAGALAIDRRFSWLQPRGLGDLETPIRFSFSPKLDWSPQFVGASQMGGLAGFSPKLDVPGLRSGSLASPLSWQGPGSSAGADAAASPWWSFGGSYLRNLWNVGAGLSSAMPGAPGEGAPHSRAEAPSSSLLSSSLSRYASGLDSGILANRWARLSPTPSLSQQTFASLRAMASGPGGLSPGGGSSFSMDLGPPPTPSISLRTSPQLILAGSPLGSVGGSPGVAGLRTTLNVPGLTGGAFAAGSGSPGAASVFGGVGSGWSR